MTFTLYHHGSSVCAAKVRFAMDEKGLPWDGVYIAGGIARRYPTVLQNSRFRSSFEAKGLLSGHEYKYENRIE